MKKIIPLIFLGISSLLADNLELSSTVVSDNEKFITSRNMGFIKNLRVSEGSYVNKGDILYEIDTSDMDAKRNQATLQISMYETQLNTVKINYERYQRLYEKGLVAKAQVEEMEMNYKNLDDMVKVAKSQLQEVNNQYQYLTIKAPNSGVVTKKMIKAGEMAIPGMPAIVLTDLSNLKIQAEINESDLFKVRRGTKVGVEIPSLNYKSTGTVDSIIPSSNPLTHTFMIKVNFKKNSKVYPGMYAKTIITSK
jgi:RND family efflux transporter MFP subunit